MFDPKPAVTEKPLQEPEPGTITSTPQDVEALGRVEERLATDAEEPVQNGHSPHPEELQYPGPLKASLILLGLITGIFLVALDQTIVGVAIPAITDDFHTIEDVGWYASAYFLTSTALHMGFGRIYQSFNIKYTFLVAIFLFEVGSLICGIAPNSATLIGGRAVAGAGAAGIFSGDVVIMAVSFPLNRRPMVQGLFGALWGVSTIVGPLIGGTLTDNASWRWCFYINLPIGVISFITVFFFLNPPSLDAASSHKPVLQRIKNLDLLGGLLFMPSIVCLLLALQWGGNTYAWSSATIIGLLVGFSVLIVIFLAWQVRLGDAAMVPPRIFSPRRNGRTVPFACLFALVFGGAVYNLVYYLPVFLQSVRGSSATRAGVQLLPLMLASVTSSVSSGLAVAVIGYYTPWLAGTTAVLAVGTGLLTHYFDADLTNPQLIGLQVVVGLGIGAGFQVPVIAVQTVLGLEDVAIGSTAVVFFQNLGGTVFVSVGQAVFQNGLLQALAEKAPLLDKEIVVHGGATAIRGILAQMGQMAQLQAVIESYVDGLQGVYRTSLGLAVTAVLAAMALEWKSVKKNPRRSDA